jgi:hypothetical protein
LNNGRSRAAAVAAGITGIASFASGMLPPLPASLLLGSSLGVLLASALGTKIGGAALKKATVRPVERKMPVVDLSGSLEPTPEMTKTLAAFDSAFNLLNLRRDRRETRKAVLKRFEEAMLELCREFPEWEGEGRLRTYLLLKSVAESLDPGHAEEYLGIAMRTLLLRNGEATEYSKKLLAEKLERMYLDPEYEDMKHLAGTLILMNKDDGNYVKSVVLDALHLWSAQKFDSLRQELKVVMAIGRRQLQSLREMLIREEEKAGRAGDEEVASRAREMLAMMDSEPGVKLGSGN